MEINIFLLCFNESVLLPHTVSHYKKQLPSCKITVYDNESTDNSVELAKSLGCNVVSWSSNNILDEDKQTELRNNCWKDVERGWIIVADMDEFVCVTEPDLENELKQGTTILKIKGVDMIGESNKVDLCDIQLQQLRKYVDNFMENKCLCFYRESIIDMRYGPGSHSCRPMGVIKYSSKEYYNKHMCNLGLPFLINKIKNRYERSHEMRKKGWSTHYTNNEAKIRIEYMKKLRNCSILYSLKNNFGSIMKKRLIN